MPLKLGVLGIDHGHIFGMLTNMQAQGCTCAAYWTDGPAVTGDKFRRVFPDLDRAEDRRRILEDPDVSMVLIAAVPQDRAALAIEAMRAGRLHIAGFNTGSNPLAVACAGFKPFTMMASADGSFGYEMEIITYPDSGIEKVEDIKGKKLAFTSETSNSGFKAPSAILKADYGMVAGTDFEPVFSGKHDNSILGVANKDYPAAAVANSVLKRMLQRDVVKAEQLKSLYKSQTFPTTGYGLVYNLKPELQEKIKEAFFSYPWEGSALLEEFSKSGEAKFVPITFKEHWAVIRKIDEANGVSYDCK